MIAVIEINKQDSAMNDVVVVIQVLPLFAGNNVNPVGVTLVSRAGWTHISMEKVAAARYLLRAAAITAGRVTEMMVVHAVRM